jgi:hypothetical protein
MKPFRAVALFVRSQGVCQILTRGKNGDGGRFCYYRGGYKEKVQDDRRGYFLHRAYFFVAALAAPERLSSRHIVLESLQPSTLLKINNNKKKINNNKI